MCVAFLEQNFRKIEYRFMYFLFRVYFISYSIETFSL